MDISAMELAAEDMYAALECQAALDMPYRLGLAILERHGWNHEDRFDFPASEFVKLKTEAAMKKARGES